MSLNIKETLRALCLGGSSHMPHPGEVDIWPIDLAALREDLAQLSRLLSADERARAERLRVPLARERFVAGRAALRTTLASYLGRPPAALSFSYAAGGKPALSGGELHFSLSHCGDLALLAVAAGGALGIDLERIADANYEVIASTYFAPAEQQALRGLPPEQRRAAFYRAWVCKEALAKAEGGGLGRGIGRFEVQIEPERPAALLRVAGEPGAERRWRLRSWQPAEGFVAALAEGIR